MSRARRSSAAAGRMVLAFVLLASACKQAPAPAPGPSAPATRLAPRFDQAEIRTDRLDLAFLAANRRLRRPAWQEPRETKHGLEVWTQEKNADVALPFATRAPKELRLRARCHKTLGPRLALEVYLNAKLLGNAVLTAEDAEFRFEVPEADQVLRENVLRLSVARRFRAPKGEDVLPAAVAVSRLELRPAGDDGPIAVPSVKHDQILLPPASSLGFFVRHRPGAELSLRVAAGRAGGRLDVALETRARRAEVGRVATAAGQEARLRTRLEADAGAFARLELANAGPEPLTLDSVLGYGWDAPTSAPLPPARLPGRPSVVVFLVDTLRADRLGGYGFGKPTSPAFDAFAREAILFEDAWAQAPWTRPTVASIFTALHPGTHGVIGFERALPDAFQTWAEIMRAAGYRTGGFVANHVVNARFGFAQGFDNWNDGQDRLHDPKALEIVERGLRFVDGGSGPFFLYLHTMEPHAPYEPSAASWQALRERGVSRRPSTPLLMERQLSPSEARYLDALYQAEILDGDNAFGALIEGLRSRGHLDSTLVLFTSDHGEEFLDHGGKGHGHTLYRELTRVPLALRLPGGLRAGSREAQPVAQVDLLPTFASLLGLPPPRLCEGRDLSSLFLGRAKPRDAPELVSETRFGKSERSALRIGALKLIENADPRRYGSAGGRPELFDLARDPAEREDLSEQDPIAARWMRIRLAEILDLQRRARAARGEARVELTDEDREELRALGYVQ